MLAMPLVPGRQLGALTAVMVWVRLLRFSCTPGSESTATGGMTPGMIAEILVCEVVS
jgi:hypothetical protein